MQFFFFCTRPDFLLNFANRDIIYKDFIEEQIKYRNVVLKNHAE